MECHILYSPSLGRKNIGYTILCRKIAYPFDSIGKTSLKIKEVLDFIFKKNTVIGKIEFLNKEPIGSNYTIAFYKVYLRDYSSKGLYVRAVVLKKRIRSIIVIVPKELDRILKPRLKEENKLALNIELVSFHHKKPIIGELPPGQKYIRNFITYKAFGIPYINANSWKLTVNGLTKRERKYTLHDIMNMKSIEYEADFHCVTGWSIERVLWKGVPLTDIIGEDNVSANAKWAYLESIDGYSTSIPLNDLLNEYTILVTAINREKLAIEHGFPLRVFSPYLYGWKSIKWITKITITDKFVPGYWEALGYHPRGYVWYEERFFI